MSRCASFDFILRAGTKKGPSKNYYLESDETWVFLNFSEKSWEEVAFEEIEHFPGWQDDVGRRYEGAKGKRMGKGQDNVGREAKIVAWKQTKEREGRNERIKHG